MKAARTLRDYVAVCGEFRIARTEVRRFGGSRCTAARKDEPPSSTSAGSDTTPSDIAVFEGAGRRTFPEPMTTA